MVWRIRFQSLLGCVLSLLMRVGYKKEFFCIHSDDLSRAVPSLSSSYRVGFSCLPPRDMYYHSAINTSRNYFFPPGVHVNAHMPIPHPFLKK